MSVSRTSWLRLLIVLAAVLAGGGAWLARRGRSGVRQPNVVMIVIDTLRADHLGSYGYARPTSPQLDALAASGVRFVTTRATSSWTAASVASIFTGLYPAVHGLEGGDAIVDGRWKLIRSADARHLYDLAADPGEAHDLEAAGTSAGDRLAALLDDRARLAASIRIAPGTVPPFALRRARLKALGYAE